MLNSINFWKEMVLLHLLHQQQLAVGGTTKRKGQKEQTVLNRENQDADKQNTGNSHNLLKVNYAKLFIKLYFDLFVFVFVLECVIDIILILCFIRRVIALLLPRAFIFSSSELCTSNRTDKGNNETPS